MSLKDFLRDKFHELLFSSVAELRLCRLRKQNRLKDPWIIVHFV